MRTFYEGLLEHLKALHAEAIKDLEGLPVDALDWVPGPEMNSISVLIMHFTGSERYWVGDVVRADPSFRNRDAEFQTKGMDAAALRQRILDLDEYEAKMFEDLRVRDLESWKVAPKDGQQRTVGWALLHALQHTAVHIGHIEILTQQWKQQHPA